MAIFTRFYLDREKDIIVTLEKPSCDYELDYTISTPNHGTGNLITNLAVMCGLEISMDENGLKVIKGKIPSYHIEAAGILPGKFQSQFPPITIQWSQGPTVPGFAFWSDDTHQCTSACAGMRKPP